VPALPWRSQVQAEDAEGGSQKVQNAKCKVVVSLRDGILILTTNKHEFSDRITGLIRYINRRERKGSRVYKYMHIYLWSTLCFETQI